MHRQITSWFSPALQREMPVATYGHYGFALLLIPTAAADFLEYERFQMLEALAPMINDGKVKVYSIDSMNKESWMNKHIPGEIRALRHDQFNDYIFQEVIPFIRNTSSNDTMIYASGASFGALHALNLFLKRPDIINGTISMSGVYDLTEYTDGYWSERVYFNSPLHYLPNLEDAFYLDKIRASHHIHLYSGSGAYEEPEASRKISQILWDKGAWNDLNIWGADIDHDWPAWRSMLPQILNKQF